MRTITEVKLEMDRIRNSAMDELRPGPKKRMLKNLSFLKTIVHYIETNPDMEYLKLEVKRLEMLIKVRGIHWDVKSNDYAKLSAKELGKRRKEFEQQMETPKLREQLKVIKYILK